MYVDPGTILLITCGITALQGLLMGGVWLQDRSSTWLLWVGAIFVFGGGFLFLFMLEGFGLRHLGVGLGTGSFIIAAFCVWGSARKFEGREVPLYVLPGMLSAWLLIYLIPGGLNNLVIAALFQSLASVFIVGGAWEHWRSRNEPPLSARWWLIGLYAAVGLFLVLRAPFVALLPFPFGGLPTTFEWIAAYILWLDVAAFVLTAICIVLTKQRMEFELRAFALADPLTNLLNRRAFALDVAKTARRLQHSGKGYCLVIFDLDHFKSVNDNYGHHFGDQVLRTFADAARAALREGDMLYRIGGEEFCCLMPETSEDEAMRWANVLRIDFRSLTMTHGSASLQVTVSGGISSSLKAGADPARVQASADEALYRAKRLGRDRIATSDRGPPRPDLDIEWAA
jgi:diguanylate cyclase (GGDEF)-like protein